MNIIVRILREFIYGGFERYGKYYSSYRGFVYDNQDPLNLNRIKLVIPHITLNDYHDYWALPKGGWAGKGFGTQVVPQKNELVWVEFENGNPDHPIWSHGYYGIDRDTKISEKPNFDERFKDLNTYWICTPGGNYAIINDTENEITIKTKSGNYVQVNDSGVSNVLNGNKMVSLGSLNKSAHPANYGDVAKDILTLLNDWNDTFETALNADITFAVTNGIPFLGYTNMKLQLPILKSKVNSVKDKLKGLLSNKVSLD